MLHAHKFNLHEMAFKNMASTSFIQICEHLSSTNHNACIQTIGKWQKFKGSDITLG